MLVKCASFSTYQTAETLKPDEKQIGFGFGMLNHLGESFDSSDDILVIPPIIPSGDIFARFGIVENFDAGIKITIPLAALIDVKFQVLPNEILAVAPSLGFGFSLITFNYHANLFISKRSESLTFYFVPKYIYGHSLDYKNWMHIYGIGSGIFIGREAGVWLDLNFLNSITYTGSSAENGIITNLGIGVSFTFK